MARFLRPHTGREAAKIANNEAGAEYNPAIRQGRGELRGSRQRQKNISSWFAGLAKEYGQEQSQANAAFKTEQDAVTQRLADANAAGQSSAAEAAAKDAALAKLIGGPTDSAGNQTRAQAIASAGQARAQLAQLPAEEQANFIAALGGRRSASRLQGIEAHREENTRRAKILSDLSATRREKGQARVVAKDKIREADRAQAAEQAKLRLARREARTSEESAAASAATARANLLREVREGKISARQAQERIQVSRANARIAAFNAATSRKSQRATAKHYKQEAKNSKGGLTASERLQRKEGHRNAYSTAKRLITRAGEGTGGKSDKWWAELEEGVSLESEVSPADARAAVARIRAEAEARHKQNVLGHSHR